MPTVIEIPCPNCDKPLKVPDTVFGKKIKCKHCAHPFVVEDPDAKPAKPAKGAKPSKPGGAVKAKKEAEPKKEEPKPAPVPYQQDDDEGEGGAKPNPLGVIAENDVPLCPSCAKELEPPTAVLCVHCGFNNLTREKAETKKVWAPDSNDYMNHLGPGVGAALVAIGLLVLDIVVMLKMREWMTDSWLQSDDPDPMDANTKKFHVRPSAFVVLIWALTVMPIIGTARFAIKRLAIDNQPMEKVKK